MKKLLFFAIYTMAHAVLAGCTSKESTEIGEHYSAPPQDKVVVANLITNHNYALAQQKADSLLTIYPNDPQIHTLKGFAYYITNNSRQMKAAFKQSLQIYDNLLAQRPDFSDEINKAMCILFVKGDAAYQKYLDKVERMEEYKDSEPMSSKSIPLLFRDVTPEKIIHDNFSEEVRFIPQR